VAHSAAHVRDHVKGKGFDNAKVAGLIERCESNTRREVAATLGYDPISRRVFGEKALLAWAAQARCLLASSRVHAWIEGCWHAPLLACTGALNSESETLNPYNIHIHVHLHMHIRIHIHIHIHMHIHTSLP
jgi:hypothetical protein